ncbi:MAG: hypothetical protein OEY23_04905 [Acidimicrobiia bacterium]|nr:hypothetical protein [Acidimicrobiia bacterium]
MAVEVALSLFEPVYEDAAARAARMLVLGSNHRMAAALALHRAGNRFVALSADGVELSDEEFESWAQATGPRLAVEDVSEVRLSTHGPWIETRWAHNLPPAARERMVTILLEELAEVGIIEGVIAAPIAGEISSSDPVAFPG